MQLIHLNWESLSILEKEESFKLEYSDFEKRHNPHRYVTMCKSEAGQMHLLMKQIPLNVPVQKILENYPKLANCINLIQLQIQEIFRLNTSQQVHQDYTVQLLWENCLIWSEIDLIVINPEKSQFRCINWTWNEGNVPTEATIQQHWKTQLPLFILTENYNLAPESLSFTNWFVNGCSNTSIEYNFDYNTAQFNSFFERLHKTLQKLSTTQPEIKNPNEYYLRLAEEAPEVEI